MEWQQNDTNENQPLCLFGPGGDYHSAWPEPSGSVRYRDTGSTLTGYILGVIAAEAKHLFMWFVTDTKRSNKEMNRDVAIAAQEKQTVTENTKRYSRPTWRTSYASTSQDQKKILKQSKGFSHPKPASGTNSSAYPELSKEKWLFPDFEGIGTNDKPNTNHRVRTRQRPRRKGHSPASTKQVSLFDN